LESFFKSGFYLNPLSKTVEKLNKERVKGVPRNRLTANQMCYQELNLQTSKLGLIARKGGCFQQTVSQSLTIYPVFTSNSNIVILSDHIQEK
jgi:hypothetical protein